MKYNSFTTTYLNNLFITTSLIFSNELYSRQNFEGIFYFTEKRTLAMTYLIISRVIFKLDQSYIHQVL